VSPRPGSKDLAPRLELIAILDPDHTGHDIVDLCRTVVGAGAPAVQLRWKSGTPAEILQGARRMIPIARKSGALFFVNDRFDIALAAGADGVHVGPEDIPVDAIRRAVGDRLLIGTSADDPGRATALVTAGADYIGCGTVYATTTKGDAGDVIGLDGLLAVVEAVEAPVVGIGGITPGRAADVRSTGAAGVAVIGAVCGAEDPGSVVRSLLE